MASALGRAVIEMARTSEALDVACQQDGDAEQNAAAVAYEHAFAVVAEMGREMLRAEQARYARLSDGVREASGRLLDEMAANDSRESGQR